MFVDHEVMCALLRMFGLDKIRGVRSITVTSSLGCVTTIQLSLATLEGEPSEKNFVVTEVVKPAAGNTPEIR
jgi:hypothetical protein